MILNHKAAIVSGSLNFNRYTILNPYALLAENLLPDAVAAGRIRRIPVNIGSSVYHLLDIAPVFNECFEELQANFIC